MFLLEFAAQGVRGVAPAGGRATLRPGYNVVAADGPALRRLLEALLLPDARDGDALPRAAAGPAAAPLRAGLTFVGNDKVTYRLVRDFAAGCQLHRFDQERRAFALVAGDLAAVAQALRAPALGVPPAQRLHALLSLSAAELPSRAGGGLSVGPSLAPQRSSLSPEQARRRIEALRGELEKARVAEKVQYQLDGLQARTFKLEEALRAGQRLEDDLGRAEGARAELEPVAAAAAAMGDPAARFAAFERAAGKREEALARVAAEREALAGAEARGRPEPFWRLPEFWAGAGGGAIALLVAALGARALPDLRYVALLDIPAFGWSAWVALGWIGQLEAWERIARRRRIVDDWEAKVEAQFARDSAEVNAALAALQLQKPGELKEALARLAAADAAVAAAREALERWRAEPGTRTASEEKARVEAEQRDLEAKLGEEAGGFVRDVRSIEAELQRLEAEAAAPAAAAPAPASASAAPAPAAGGEPLRALLERSAAELGGTPAAAVRAVSAKASQALSGLSFQRLQALQADDRGNVTVQTAGRLVPSMTLPPADRDLVFLALKLALLEHALAGGRGVALLEDAFTGLSDGARRFAGRLLKQAARGGQIVHATSDPAFKESADHVV
jgi:hypothetical protein